MKIKLNIILLALLLASTVIVPLLVFQGCGSDEYAIPTADPNAPIAINGGASVTDTTSVILTLHRVDAAGVVGYFVSENATAPAAGDAGWVTVTQITTYDATGIPFTLSATEGSKTVYVWFKNAAAAVSTTASASIKYDDGIYGN